ncbi:Isopenicillin N epimerase [Rubrobacter xylanophilus DSM 9941]|uniref:aminotransferase class V-fold PLP-dependent enzyme n=1 Tax=Rubrobacter xylanophilus TaxID=49319 RepID=UPI001C63D9E3|nr:aminotransferase class V-fold PLP-dependent enzyme [Rubrobacter xylanophilus]QYJ17301.1 Isopenicillin N epimerase [Rubrobacter xylanophilus DSM 9941]
MHGTAIISARFRSPRPTRGGCAIDRSEIPALDGNDYAYLNSGASGPPTRRVLKAARAAEELCCGPAYLEGPGFFARCAAFVERAREAAAHLLGASPEDIALTTNTTQGINLGLGALDWRAGDEVISSLTEHPGCLVPLHGLRERHGVRLRLLEPPITPGRAAAEMTPRTRLVALSHVDWTTGQALPVEEISAIARRRGALTLVDGAQSVGAVPVNLPEIGADLYAFTGHKWLLGPEGMGGLYVRPGLDLPSPNLGYLSVEDPAAFRPEGGYRLHPGAQRFESSTTSPALAAGFAEAARAASERGAELFEEIRRRAALLAGMLAELPNVRLRTPLQPAAGLVSFEVEGVGADEAVARLLERRFVLRRLPGGSLRASTHLFNTEEELEGLVRAVRELS